MNRRVLISCSAIAVIGVSASALLLANAAPTAAPVSAPAKEAEAPDADPTRGVSADPEQRRRELTLDLIALTAEELSPEPSPLEAFAGAFSDALPPERSPLVAGASPDELLARVEAVAPLPYRGALRSPETVASAGAANTLDRARLLRALLAEAGHTSRIVSTTGSVAYAESAPAPKLTLAPSLRARLETETDATAARLREALAGETAWLQSGQELPANERVFLVQVEEDGAWRTLRCADTTLADGALAVLGAEEEQALTWQVTFRVVVDGIDERSNPQRLVLEPAVTRSAESLHATPITFLTQPDTDYLTIYAPTLRIGGEAFTWSTPRRPFFGAHDVALEIAVEGPGSERSFFRPVTPTGDSGGLRRIPGVTSMDLLLRRAALTRVVLLTAPASDAEYERAVFAEARYAGQVLLGEVPLSCDDRTPTRLLALLDACLRTAGRFGRSSQAAFCYQDRPALALETSTLTVQAEGLTRWRALDLVDAGHAVAGPHAAQAALEQCAVDGILEQEASDADAVTSHGLLTQLLEENDALDAALQPLARETVNGSQPPRRFGRLDGDAAGVRLDDVAGVRLNDAAGVRLDDVAGVRLDPGPMATPLLADGRGGSRERVRDVPGHVERANVAKFALAYVPDEVLPAAALAGGLATYLAQLAQAYASATEGMDVVCQLMDKAKTDAEVAAMLAKVQEEIRGLGPALAQGLAEGLIGQLAKAHRLRGIDRTRGRVSIRRRGRVQQRVYSKDRPGAFKRVAKSIATTTAEQKAIEAAKELAPVMPNSVVTREVVRLAQQLKQGGVDADARREAIVRLD